jgi:ABC-type transport system involved in cytochrome bd biosynthesis fused ATPase/permease subunit
MQAFTKSILVVSVILITIFVVVPFILDSYLPQFGTVYVRFITDIMHASGESADALNWRSATWTIVLPLVASVAIIYSLLSAMPIMGRSQDAIYLVIAFAWVGSLLYTGYLWVAVRWIYAIGAFLGLVFFVGIFIMGLIFKFLIARVFHLSAHAGSKFYTGMVRDRRSDVAAAENEIVNLIRSNAKSDKIHNARMKLQKLKGELEKFQREEEEAARREAEE